jgi:hypothetical protein
MCSLESEAENEYAEADPSAAVAIHEEESLHEDQPENSDYRSSEQSNVQPRIWKNREEWMQHLMAKGEPVPLFEDSAAPNNENAQPNQRQVRRSNIEAEPLYQELTSYGNRRNPRVTEVEVVLPGNRALGAAAAGGEIQLTNIKPPRFDGDGSLNWEDFEAHIESQFDGKNFKQQRSLLQACLGPKPRKWYFQKDELWLQPIAEQMRRLRNKYSVRRDGEEDYGVPHDVVMIPGESIDDYEMRVTEACVHLRPRTFKRIPGEPREKEAFREIKYFADKVAYNKMEKGVFIGGLPNKFRTRLFNNNELRAKPLADIVDECKKWEKTQKMVKHGDVTNMQLQAIAFESAKATTYLTQKLRSESGDEDSEAEDQPKFVELANKAMRGKDRRRDNSASRQAEKVKAEVDAQIVREKKTEKQEKMIQTLLAKMEQIQEQVKPEKIQEQIASLGESLPDMIKTMMTKDTKPTAKAGTKGDPMTEDTEQQYQERQQKYNNRGGGYSRGWGRGRGRGRGFGRGGFNKRGNGPNNDERQQHQGQSANPAENKKQDDKPNWDKMDKMADAMQKTAVAMQQQTAAFAQILDGSKN